MTATLTEAAPNPTLELDFPRVPPAPSDRPTDDADSVRCGVCGENKVKLPVTTTYRDLPVYVCTNIVDDPKLNPRQMPCDGYAYKNAVFNYSDYAG